MINIKLSIILGCAGLILSLAVGLVTGAGFPLIFIRAGIFAALFFGLGCGIWLLINNFIPELLFMENTGESGDFTGSTGSRVDITLDDSKGLPEMYRNLSNDDEVGNITDLISGADRQEEAVQPLYPDDIGPGMDQKPEVGYTGNGNRGDFASNSSQDDLGNTPGVLDLDAMAGSFLGDTLESVPAGPAEQPAPVRSPLGNKAQKMEGDFNPKELAAGIRTVLKKDE